MFTIDASVHINALNVSEGRTAASQAFLERVHRDPLPVYSPTLLLTEVAATIARIFNDTSRALALAHAMHKLPGQVWVALDESLADDAARIAAVQRLRGADAVYAAVARRYGTVLVTLDQQQLVRLRGVMAVSEPEDALQGLPPEPV